MKERDRSTDFIRGFAILCVVLGHSIQANLTEESNVVWDVILHFQMPLLFMISGYTMGWTEPAKSISNSLKRRVKRLLIPYLVWMTIHFFLRKILVPGYAQTGIKAYGYEIFHSNFWFLWELFLFYLLIIMCEVPAKLTKNAKAGFGIALIPATVLVYILDKKLGFFKLPMLGIKYWAFFMIGYLLWNMLRWKPVRQLTEKKAVAIALFGGCTLMILVDVYWIVTGREMHLITSTLTLSLFMSAYICFNCMGIKADKLPRFITEINNVGRNTLGIYAFHWCILFYSLWMAGIYKRLLSEMPLSVRVVITYTVWILLCQLSVRLIKKSKLMKALLLGE